MSNQLNPVLIFISAMLVNNIILIRFLGLCSFFGLSDNLKNSLGMSATVLFVMVMATAVTWPIYHFLLVPLNLVFLRTMVFVLTIASLVQFVELFLRRHIPVLYRAMGIYLPLVTTNCAILAVTFLNIDYKLSFLNSIIYALGVSVGYGVAILLLAGIRERLTLSGIPESIGRYPLAFFTASLMSLGFLGFKGLFGL